MPPAAIFSMPAVSARIPLPEHQIPITAIINAWQARHTNHLGNVPAIFRQHSGNNSGNISGNAIDDCGKNGKTSAAPPNRAMSGHKRLSTICSQRKNEIAAKTAMLLACSAAPFRQYLRHYLRQ